MYEEKYYGVYFIMKTPDDKKISDMDSHELYWTAKRLELFKEDIDEEIRKRQKELYEDKKRNDCKKLCDKYLDRIKKGTGKGEKAEMEALNILLDIFFHEIKEG